MAAIAQLKQIHSRSRRFLRALAGKDLFTGPQVHCETLRLGNDRAQWAICPIGLSRSSVVYAFGTGEDISFEIELIQRFSMHIHAFDPTPRAIQWIKHCEVPDGFHFHPVGVADCDGIAEFSPPKNPSHVSFSAARGEPAGTVQAPVNSLTSIMKMLGHATIDVLKMDIEGFEYRVLANLARCSARPKQILVEFHHRWPEFDVSDTKYALAQLNQHGYRIFDVSASGEEFSLIRL